MKKKFVWRISLIAAATVLSILFFLPSTSMVSSLPDWLKKYGITLGQDLQGGVHLVYEVDIDKTVDVTTERIASSLTNTFKEKKIEAKTEKQGLDIIIFPDNDQIKKIVQEQFPTLTLESQSE